MENQRKAKEMAANALSYNKLVLTLGYGALFAALSWLHGKIPDKCFFITVCLLLASLGFFFAYLILESYALSKPSPNLTELCMNAWRCFFFFSLIPGVIASGFVFYSAFSVAWHGVPIDKIAVLEREKTALETQLDTALRILHHERLMHFGIASGDVEKIMREKASRDVVLSADKK